MKHLKLIPPGEKAVMAMFKEFLIFLNRDMKSVKHIFVHNLGAFDGYFIFKYLAQLCKPSVINTILDEANNFIRIQYCSVNFIDSLRLFPVSLQELCQVFNNGVGKISKYQPEFNNISLFENQVAYEKFLEYANQDAIVLYLSMVEATKHYLEHYGVELCRNLSLSSLSLKIFRQRFMKKSIPALNNQMDSFIRNSYYGGSTDIYKQYAKDLYYYDVNSLYPFVMQKYMPLNPIAHYKAPFDLKNFFGFALAKVTAPEGIENPILIFRHEGKTIHPKGTWVGVYFSEELRAALKFGYKIELLEGIHFEKGKLFNDYIKHFYEIKKANSTGPLRFISKLHLNTLYGIFGRKIAPLETLLINNDDLDKYMATKSIRNIIPINEVKSLISFSEVISNDILYDLNATVQSEMDRSLLSVKSNVAIASAITAYARIEMMKYKKDSNICYTDTDSIFTTVKLSEDLVGPELGEMKDEMKGLLIKEAYFLDIKKYGYWYLDLDGNRVEKSTIAGVKKNSIPFKDIEALARGETLNVTRSNVFYKSLQNLSISIKDVNVQVKNSPNKVLVNNKYQPLVISNLEHKLYKSMQR